MKEYDVIIVGAGLFGATVARICTNHGLKCLILEKRNSIGGNCRDKIIEGINVHLYGPHIFHTSNKEVWEFANRYTQFNNFRYSPLACDGHRIFNLPFNMNTFYQLYGTSSPEEAAALIKTDGGGQNESEAMTLEEKAIAMVGRKVYEVLVKGYTEKQWGRNCRELPGDIISRLPLRFTFDNNYFNDIYQGIPIGGYHNWISNILSDIEIKKCVDFNENPFFWIQKTKKVVHTGSIDEFFKYKFGVLDYRSLYWEHEILDTDNFQGVAAVNYTTHNVPYTRIIEHKHFEFGTQDNTVISKEYPQTWQTGNERYYPITNSENRNKHAQYMDLAHSTMPDIVFGGRMGFYRYLDMDDTIAEAFTVAHNIISHFRRAN